MWNMIQCAVQGRGHISTETPCQDKTYVCCENDTYVIALADGAGSARLSHYGAEYVTKRACEMLVADFDMFHAETDGVAIKRKVIGDLSSGLKAEAVKHDCQIKDLASTLLVAAIKEDKYILIHIGDGVIGYLKGNELKVASAPENGEFVNTTVFVTSNDVLYSMKIMKGSLGEIQGFTLMSDGTESSFYNKRENSLAIGLKKMMYLSQIIDSEYLESEIRSSFEEVIRQNTTDDCSVALLVKADSTFCDSSIWMQKVQEKILGYNKAKQGKKRMQRLEEVLSFLMTPNTLCAVARRIGVKKKYAKKYLDILMRQSLVSQDGNLYFTTVK